MKGHLEEVINFHLLLQDEVVFSFISQIATMIDFKCLKGLIGFELETDDETVAECLHSVEMEIEEVLCRPHFM